MFTRNGKGLTAKGVKPLCSFQQVFQSLYVFGAFSPLTGDHFELEMPHCNADTFQIFLNQFSERKADEFKIVLLDNGAFHKAKRLVIPPNVALLFLPPYAPELNPAEKIWWRLKRAFTGKVHATLDAVSAFITDQVQQLSEAIVKQTCAYAYLTQNDFKTNLN